MKRPKLSRFQMRYARAQPKDRVRGFGRAVFAGSIVAGAQRGRAAGRCPPPRVSVFAAIPPLQFPPLFSALAVPPCFHSTLHIRLAKAPWIPPRRERSR
eukprot:1366812-Pleurochrysis_carterae.AAC.1